MIVPKEKEILEEPIFRTLRNVLEERELPSRVDTPAPDIFTSALTSPLWERQGSFPAFPLSSLHHGEQQTTTTASVSSSSPTPYRGVNSSDTTRTSSSMSESPSRSLFSSSIPSSLPRPQSPPLTRPELQQSKFSGFSYFQSRRGLLPTPAADNTHVKMQLMSPATQSPTPSRSLSPASSVSLSESPFFPDQLPTSSSSSSAQPPAVQPRSPLQTVPLLRPRPMMPGLAYLSQPSVASSAFAPPIQRADSPLLPFLRRG